MNHDAAETGTVIHQSFLRSPICLLCMTDSSHYCIWHRLCDDLCVATVCLFIRVIHPILFLMNLRVLFWLEAVEKLTVQLASLSFATNMFPSECYIFQLSGCMYLLTYLRTLRSGTYENDARIGEIILKIESEKTSCNIYSANTSFLDWWT